MNNETYTPGYTLTEFNSAPPGPKGDANGNLTGGGAFQYDVENRLVSQSQTVGGWQPNSGWNWALNFGYDPWGKRVVNCCAQTDGQTASLYTFYGINGKRLATYQATVNDDATYTVSLQASDLYFAGTLMQANGAWVSTDRLGSVRANSNGEQFAYYPYGLERTSTPNQREKFGTYFRDTLNAGWNRDYADQRYYDENGGFWSADPYYGSISPREPQTWNRYSYGVSDPINHADPTGLCTINGVIYPDGLPPCPNVTSVTVYSGVPGGIFPGSGGGGPANYYSLDPLPLTGPQKVAMISDLRSLVKSGSITDCDALADYVDAVAEGLQDSRSATTQLKAAIALLTPNQLPVPLIPGVTGNAGYQAINSGSSPSGFLTQFQDQIPNADQVHHFAAFFQLGFVYGGDVAMSAASWWEKLEGTAGNVGDINLGAAAGLIGSYVASGVLPMSDVGSAIRENICKH